MMSTNELSISDLNCDSRTSTICGGGGGKRFCYVTVRVRSNEFFSSIGKRKFATAEFSEIREESITTTDDDKF